MTNRQIRSRFATLVAIGILGVTGLAALAAEAPTVSSTFLSVAEKFGVFAAMCIGLVVCAVYGLWRLTQYVVLRMETVIDDNTLAFRGFARAMERRPCISDSDVDRIIAGEDDEDSSGIASRVKERRRQREEKKGL